MRQKAAFYSRTAVKMSRRNDRDKWMVGVKRVEVTKGGERNIDRVSSELTWSEREKEVEMI